MERPLRLGVVQTTTGIDPTVNAAGIANALETLADAGARIAFTPEMSGLLDRNRERLLAHAPTEADEPTLAAAREVAARRGMWVALGSCAVRTGSESLANRSFLIDDGGAIAARYDKIHRFDVDLGEGHRYRESATFAAGETAVVAETPWGRLGLSICYDLRFSSLYDALTAAGAELIAIPAAFTRPTGTAHWHVLQRARAILGQAFVIAAAQTGHHADGRETYGHSLVIGPWGNVLLDMGTEPGTAVIDIDLAAGGAIRQRIPALSHRRGFASPA